MSDGSEHLKMGPVPKFFPVMANDMTLRDYFAAQGMQAMMLAADSMQLHGIDSVKHVIAATAYSMADAMLKAREQ